MKRPTNSLALAAAAITATLPAAKAATVFTSDYDFADNTIPAAFTTTSYGAGPATGGGVLTFDGSTAIQGATNSFYGGSAPTDNYGYEVIITPSQLDAFDLIASITAGAGGNFGSIIYRQPNYGLIDAGDAAPQGDVAAAVGTTVALALVMDNGIGRLFVDGVEKASIGFAGGATPVAALDTVVLGGNLFDGAAGAFNGSVDRFRTFTFDAGTFDSAALLGPGDGTIPEPASLILVGLGALLGLRRRR